MISNATPPTYMYCSQQIYKQLLEKHFSAAVQITLQFVSRLCGKYRKKEKYCRKCFEVNFNCSFARKLKKKETVFLRSPCYSQFRGKKVMSLVSN